MRAKALAEYTNAKTPRDTEVLYFTMVHKIDKQTYKHNKDDIVLLTNAAIFVISYPKVKFKYRIPYHELASVSVSQFYDGIVVLHSSGKGKKDAGDRIYDSPHAIEFVANIARAYRISQGTNSPQPLQVDCKPQIDHGIKGKKTGKIVFKLFGEAGFEVLKSFGGSRCLQVTHPKIASSQGFRTAVRGSMKRKPQTSNTESYKAKGNNSPNTNNHHNNNKPPSSPLPNRKESNPGYTAYEAYDAYDAYNVTSNEETSALTLRNETDSSESTMTSCDLIAADLTDFVIGQHI